MCLFFCVFVLSHKKKKSMWTGDFWSKSLLLILACLHKVFTLSFLLLFYDSCVKKFIWIFGLSKPAYYAYWGSEQGELVSYSITSLCSAQLVWLLQTTTHWPAQFSEDAEEIHYDWAWPCGRQWRRRAPSRWPAGDRCPVSRSSPLSGGQQPHTDPSPALSTAPWAEP